MNESESPYVHESSCIDPDVQIGEGTKIWHYTHISRGARIGRDCTLGQNVFIGENVRIGDRVKIQNNVSVYRGVELGDDVFCGPSCVFTNVDRPRSGFPTDASEYQTTPVGEGATIGANATIVCGHRLGAYCFVGAGAVVTKNIPAHAVVYGNPARIHGWVCACGAPLEFDAERATCSACGRNYWKDGDVVTQSP